MKIEVNGKKISGLDVDLHIEDLHILDVFCAFRTLFCCVETFQSENLEGESIC